MAEAESRRREAERVEQRPEVVYCCLALLDSLPAAAYMCNPDGLISYYNDRAVELWGRAPALLDPADRYCGSVRMLTMDGSVVAPDEGWMAVALNQQKRHENCEVLVEREDGTRVPVLASIQPIVDDEGRLLGAVNVMLDLSERRQAEGQFRRVVEALAPTTGRDFFRASANQLCRTLGVKYALIGVLDSPQAKQVHTLAMSREGRLLDNLSYDLRDTPCEDVIGRRVCYFPSGVQKRYPKDAMLVETQTDTYMGIPLFSSQREALGLIVLLHDRPLEQPEAARAILEILAARASAELERERAEEALRESERRYAGLVNNLDGIVWEKDAGSSRFRFVSRQAGRLLGFPVSRWLEDPDFWADRLHREDRDRVLEQTTSFRSQGVDYELEYRMVAADESVVWFHELVTIEAVDGVSVTLRGVMLDVTERKLAEEEHQRLESQLLHAQKLESLGVLVGGIAHDFNNLLTPILANAELAMMDLPPDSPAKTQLHEIEKSATRSAELTQQLLSYSGKGNLEIRPFRLDELVREMANLLHVIVSKKASLDLFLDPVTIEGDATQVRQVVMNLITNASDALGDQGGTIRVRTGVSTQAPGDLDTTYFPDEPTAGSFAFVEVADDGCGIAKEDLDRIFDPFFTTKFMGRGLGLAATIGIVRSHGGGLDVDSQPGRGTVFRVLLPRATVMLGEKPESGEIVDLPRGRGTVLVIDDERAVLGVIRRACERVGFRVLTAEDGEAGVEIFEAHREEVVAVFLDLTMPRMDGAEVWNRLRHQVGEVPVIIMSGYSADDVVERCAGIDAGRFLHKPFRTRQLMERINELIPAAPD